MDNIKKIAKDLEVLTSDLDGCGYDAILTSYGPLLVGDARFSVPFSEARYRCLINRLGVMVLELTITGAIVYSNEIMAKITGIPTHKLLDSNCFDIIKPLSFESNNDLHDEFLGNIELIDYQTCLVTKEGDYKVISWNTFDIFNGEQQLERIVYFGIDITEQQKAEQDLAISAIAFDSQLAMMIYDSNGVIVKVNSAYTKLTGYDSDDLVGNIHHLAYSRHHVPEFYAAKKKALQDYGSWNGEIWNQCKQGEDYLEYRTVNAVTNKDGIRTHYVSTHKDISVSKLSEEKLNIAAVAFESAQSMFVTDAGGFFQHINSAFTVTTGYSLNELVGKSPSILKSGRQDEAFYKEMWQEINIKGSWVGDIWNKRKNGEVYLEQLSIVQVTDSEGYVTNYVATFTDLTQINAYKKGLIEAKEKAERFSTLKSQFIASMSHEIRTPMTAIIGFSELALYQDMSEKVKGYVQKINIASNSLLGILQDILDFTKLEAGRVVIDTLPFNVLDLLGTIHTLFSGSAQQKGLKFTIVRDNFIPFELIGDKLRLQQVLINLIANGLKFTQQGHVKLEITLQTMTNSQVQLLFCVTDTGIGISLEDQHKLFIGFSQVDGSISRQYGGTGLGLVISKELVELMGGEISVISNTNEGSSFSFALQFYLNKSSIGHVSDLTELGSEVREKLDLNKFKGHRILVVEDNEATQSLIQEHLHNLGIFTETAQNGLEALKILEQHDFDLVLMDIHMPIMDGIVATRRIREQAKFEKLPIIAISAGVTESERNNCISCGMGGFISKPIDIEKLYAVLELWLKPQV